MNTSKDSEGPRGCGHFPAQSVTVLQSLGSTPLEWSNCKGNLRESNDSEGPSGCCELSAESVAVLQRLGSTTLELRKCMENLIESKYSEWLGGCAEFSDAVTGSVAKPRFDQP